jgi:hypothetical protein
MPWLRLFVAGLSPWRPVFDPGSVHVGFVVDKVALRQVFPRVLRFTPVSFIPPVLHYKEKRKKKIIFITGLYHQPHCCDTSVASAAGPLKTPFTGRVLLSKLTSLQLGKKSPFYGTQKFNASYTRAGHLFLS